MCAPGLLIQRPQRTLETKASRFQKNQMQILTFPNPLVRRNRNLDSEKSFCPTRWTFWLSQIPFSRRTGNFYFPKSFFLMEVDILSFPNPFSMEIDILTFPKSLSSTKMKIWFPEIRFSMRWQFWLSRIPFWRTRGADTSNFYDFLVCAPGLLIYEPNAYWQQNHAVSTNFINCAPRLLVQNIWRTT